MLVNETPPSLDFASYLHILRLVSVLLSVDIMSSYLGVFLLFLTLGNNERVFGSNQITNVTESVGVDGCIVCGEYKCPDNSERCLLGIVTDVCQCCSEGVCAKLNGEPCWNSSISQLQLERRNEGTCAENYLCQLRSDLQTEDLPEAVCVCREQSKACGNNNVTYDTPCDLHEEAMRLRNSDLKLNHLGPCPSRPWIQSGTKNISIASGTRVVLSCEARGFPTPSIFWEFRSGDSSTVLRLPNAEHDGIIRTIDGPESMMQTSWMQLPRLAEKHVGSYNCIANNSVGEASSYSYLSVL